jgi:type IV secretory pathway TrbD component
MIFEYKLESKHFQDFSFASTRELARVNGLNNQLILGALLGLAVATGAVAAAVLSGDHRWFFPFCTGAWFFWLINYAITIYITRRAASLALNPDGLTLGDRQLSIDDTGISMKGALFNEDIAWKAIKSVTVQHLVVVLWTEKISGIFVPRSVFAIPEDEQKFVTFVQSKIKVP